MEELKKELEVLQKNLEASVTEKATAEFALQIKAVEDKIAGDVQKVADENSTTLKSITECK